MSFQSPSFHAQHRSRMRIAIGESRLKCLWDAMMANRGVGIKSWIWNEICTWARHMLHASGWSSTAPCVFAFITDDIYLDGCSVWAQLSTCSLDWLAQKRNRLLQLIQTHLTLFSATDPLRSTRVMNCEMAALKGHFRSFHVQRRGDQKHKKAD